MELQLKGVKTRTQATAVKKPNTANCSSFLTTSDNVIKKLRLRKKAPVSATENQPRCCKALRDVLLLLLLLLCLLRSIRELLRICAEKEKVSYSLKVWHHKKKIIIISLSQSQETL